MEELHVSVLGRGFAWLDCGTHESLMEAGSFIRTIEHRQGMKVAGLEEIVINQGWLNQQHFGEQAEALKITGYSQYLQRLLQN